MTDPKEREFSVSWVVLSVVLFLAVELVIGTWIGPWVIGKYVSPMFHPQLQMALHLLSFYLGGLGVGVVSPGRRLVEPAVGAFIAVLLVFLMALFLPNVFLVFSMTKVLVGGGIAMLIALAGAWQGEKLMGNLEPASDADRLSARARLRASLWTEDEDAVSRRRTGLRD
jgi:hypothetical protein